MAEPLLHAFAKPTKTDFIRIVRGNGALLWDDKGNEYIDAIGSLWYSQIGHGLNAVEQNWLVGNGHQLLGAGAVSYTHLTLPTNREV